MERVSFDRWLDARVAASAMDDDVARVLGRIAKACAEIAAQLRIHAVAGEGASLDTVNVQGEVQKKLDVVANEIFMAAGRASGGVHALVSEELDDIVLVEGGEAARLALIFDPLDGSSNLEVNGAVGSIFSLVPVAAGAAEAGVLQSGRAQLAAGYALYGPATYLVVTDGDGAHGFVLDEGEGAFLKVGDALEIPRETNEYAINASRQRHWYGGIRDYVSNCIAGRDGPYGKTYNMRWCAAMVADLHRILCRGGIFLYPEDRETQAKGGRLRLLYEANPMGMIVEAAGGRASTGTGPILDVEPRSLHQRIGVVIGSAEEVEKVEALMTEKVAG